MQNQQIINSLGRVEQELKKIKKLLKKAYLRMVVMTGGKKKRKRLIRLSKGEDCTRPLRSANLSVGLRDEYSLD